MTDSVKCLMCGQLCSTKNCLENRTEGAISTIRSYLCDADQDRWIRLLIDRLPDRSYVRREMA